MTYAGNFDATNDPHKFTKFYLNGTNVTDSSGPGQAAQAPPLAATRARLTMKPIEVGSLRSESHLVAGRDRRRRDPARLCSGGFVVSHDARSRPMRGGSDDDERGRQPGRLLAF